ncbi:MAG: cyclic nucleotide-binding domain-containing protein [Anaerolineae bacterium]
MRDPTPEEQVEIIRALESVQPSPPLSPSEMVRWARQARILEVAQGQVIIAQGDMPDYLYLVLSGQLRTIVDRGGQQQTLNYHGAPAFVGEYGILHHAARTATVDAVSDAKLACWSVENAARLLCQNEAMRTYLKGVHILYIERAGQQFPGRQWDETVVFRTRKHVIQLLSALIPLLVLFSMGVFLSLGMSLTWGQSFLPHPIVGIFILIGLAWGAFKYFDWANDEYIVTSKRVIHIERLLLYGEERDEAPLVRIQDVTVITTSLLQRWLDYCDLYIKTAGAGTIVFSGMPHAQRVRELIFEERDRERERRAAEDRMMIRAALQQSIQGVALVGKDLELKATPQWPLNGTEPGLDGIRVSRLPPLIRYLYPRQRIVEKDKITWRKHWIVLAYKIIPPLVLLNGSLAALILLFLYMPQTGYFAMMIPLIIVAFVWYLFRYDEWYRDIYIIQGNRIIDIVSSGFRLRGERRREGTFDAVQNVTYEIPTFWHRLVNMGNVVIETAGTEQTFTFNSVFNPSGVQQEVFERWDAYHEELRRREREEQRRRWAEWFSEYHMLRSRIG